MASAAPCSAARLEAPRRPRRVACVNAHLDGEGGGMRWAVPFHDIIGRQRQALPLGPFLQRCLGVDGRLDVLGHQGFPTRPDETGGGLPTAIQEQGGDHRFAGVGEKIGIVAAAGLFLPRRQDDVLRQTDVRRHPGQGLAARQCGEALGQRSLVLPRKAFAEQVGDGQPEHPVAQELQPFVGDTAPGPVAGRAGMGQGLAQETALGKTVSQRLFEAFKPFAHDASFQALEDAAETN